MAKINKEKDIPNIIKMRSNGFSIKEIASMYNVSSSRIGQILRSNGINTINSRYLQFTYEEVEKMYNDYIFGISRENIAKKYNICADSVYNLFLKYDFKVKSMSHAKQQYKINEHYFDKIDTPNKAYIVGLLYADGCNMTNKHEVTLSLQERDKHILDQIKDELCYNGPLKFIDYNSKNQNYKNQYKLDITNKHISESLNALGVWKNKSLILEWPDWLDKSLYSHFVRGYFDGDGCLYLGKNNKGAQIGFIGTEMFLLKFSEILKETLDINLFIRSTDSTHKSVTKEAKIYRKNEIKNFLNWMYNNADLMLKRKYDKYQQFLHNNINNSLAG